MLDKVETENNEKIIRKENVNYNKFSLMGSKSFCLLTLRRQDTK